MVRFEPAQVWHAEHMAPRLREGDRLELEALGLPPHKALLDSLAWSSAAFTAFVDDTPASMFGVAPRQSLLGSAAVMWMLGTDLIPLHNYTVLLTSRTFVENCQLSFATLECLVDLRYTASVRWVRWLRFKQEAAVPIGGTMFGVFVRRAV